MNLLSSLTNRIFLVSALLVVAAIAVAVYRVNDAVTAQAEADLQAGLTEAAALVADFSRTQFSDSAVKSALIAGLPVLKAAVATDDPPTVAPIARDYQRQAGADLFVVLGPTDRLLATAGRVQPTDADIAAIVAACRQAPDGAIFWPTTTGVLHAMTVPIEPGPAPLGTLVVGFSLDHDAALRFKTVTRSDIVFVAGGRPIASTLEMAPVASVVERARGGDVFTASVGDEEFAGRVQALGGETAGDPVALVLRSRTQRLAFLSALHWQFAITALVAIGVATGVGYAVARTVTRPVRALTATMREMAATGDLARAVPPGGRWDDEDARVLSSTFRQLTTSLERSRRDAAQRERLSSLGRLSTVVAHEIRNPLMIIKTATRTLRSHPSPEVEDAVTSIEEEVARLNRVVTDVLDFAKPIRFELGATDLVEICRAAIQASQATPGAIDVAFTPPQSAIPIVTDAERLRSALVNVLDNAQQAVRAHADVSVPAASVRLEITKTSGGWRVDVHDKGQGISHEDQARLFEPFFTTRRGGSGLGLALVRNIVEGLGGTVAVESRPGAGTTVRIDLPETATGETS